MANTDGTSQQINYPRFEIRPAAQFFLGFMTRAKDKICYLPVHWEYSKTATPRKVTILFRRFCKSKISWRMTVALWTHCGSWQSYPYFFVFPLYCLLKIRNFPDIALLFLLQLLDFLRDRSKTRRQKAGNRLTMKVKIAVMPKNEKRLVLN